MKTSTLGSEPSSQLPISDEGCSKSRGQIPPVPVDLKSVIEVTEQNQNHQHSKLIEEPVRKVTCMERFINILDIFWGKFSGSTSMPMKMSNHDILTAITQIKKSDHKAPVFLPPQREKKKVLVLDLDETLIHTTFNRPRKFDFESQIPFNGKQTTVYTIKRFGLDNFLFQMSKLYEIVVYTASQKVYADKVIDMIDRKKRISHRLYRQHCICINNTHYLKNIKILGRRENDVIIVDDTSTAGFLQPDRFYHIDIFDGNSKDRQLCRLASFLRHVVGKSSIQSVRVERIEFQNMVIPVKEEDLTLKDTPSRSIAERQKQYKHAKRNSEIDRLAACSEQDKDEAQTTASELIKRL